MSHCSDKKQNLSGSQSVTSKQIKTKSTSLDQLSPVAALSLDAEKAFDGIEWQYLFAALETYGFGTGFLSWIILLCKEPRASVTSNRATSQTFRLYRGMRQGCPLSPLLFALALEPLAAAIRKDSNFPGIKIRGSTHKIMLYADDALVLITQPQKSIPVLLKIINQFSHLSGYRVNWAKSEALPLTSYCPKTLFTSGDSTAFSWPQAGIKYLGILFPYSLSDIIRLNFEPLLNKFQADIERWSPLYLSLWGKINVIKMISAPRFNYVLQALPLKIPTGYFQQFELVNGMVNVPD